VIAESHEPLATVSRYAKRSMRWPGTDEEARIQFLLELADRNDLEGWMLIPSTDVVAKALAGGHDELAARYTHTTPRWEVLRWAHDKRLTHELAARLRVPSPWTMASSDALNGASARVVYPVALKPAVKDSQNPLTAAKAWRIEGPQDLRRRYAEACALLDPSLLMVQELIPGNGASQLSYAALCRDGEPLASVIARRTRQYPTEFGRASTYVETVNCPEVVEPSLRLLRAIRYTGLIEIEYKRDARDGVLKLLDMNPRVWGWHTLCARAGVDFPWLLWLLASGEEIPPTRARAGVGWLRLTTDTPTSVKELLARRLSIREYVRSLRSPRERAIFAWDDPLPGLAEVPVLAYVLARRLLAGDEV